MPAKKIILRHFLGVLCVGVNKIYHPNKRKSLRNPLN